MKVPAGKNPPEDIYVVVEIPMGSSVKYEYDEEMEAIVADRFTFTAMHYPFNYGFIPQTKMDDGDPVDVLVLSREPVYPGTVIRCRPVGALITEDEEGRDVKVIAVPVSKVDPDFDGIKDVEDIPQSVRNRIAHFYEHYKELEPGKWVKVKEWVGAEEAKKIIKESLL